MTVNTNSHNPVNIDMKIEEDSGSSSHMSTTQSSVVKELTYATLSEMKETNPSPKVPPVKYEDIDFKATQVGAHTEFIVW